MRAERRDRAEERTDDLPDRHGRLERRDPGAAFRASAARPTMMKAQGRRRAHRSEG